MRGKSPRSFERHVERLWAEGIKIGDRIVAAAERASRRLLGNQGTLIPIPVRASAGRRRPGREQSRD